jgi:phenylacetate-CoA ligase
MLYDEQKEYIETFFNKPVLNVYGANDGGIMSASLNNKEFFYNGIDCFVETVDVLGYEELLLTNLTSYAFPFVRYRVGDIGILDSDGICPFVLRDIKGRTRDFVYVSDTEKIHGSAFNKVFKRHSDIVNYQVIQQENTDCVVRIITTFENKALEDESELIRDLSKLFRTINFKVEYVKEIDRANNGKQKNIISNVI